MNEADLVALIAATLRIPSTNITLDADLLGDLGADSLSFAEITIAVEGKTGRKLSIEELQDIWTVGDLLDVVNDRQGPSNHSGNHVSTPATPTASANP